MPCRSALEIGVREAPGVDERLDERAGPLLTQVLAPLLLDAVLHNPRDGDDGLTPAVKRMSLARASRGSATRST